MMGWTLTEYEPWLLGFCRWEVARVTDRGAYGFREVYARGRWRWRGRDARLVVWRHGGL